MHTHKPNSTGRSKRLRPNLKIAGEGKGGKNLQSRICLGYLFDF